MRSFFSFFIGIIFVLLLLCSLLIALLPTIASTDWGRKQVVSWINLSIPGKIEILALDLHWGKGQTLKGILLKDPEGQSVLGIEKFSTEATLWQLLQRSTRLGFTQIQDLNAAIVTDEKGWTNLQRALGIAPSANIPPLSPSTIILSDVNADFYLFTENHPLSASINGLTRQDNLAGSFEINLALNGLQASNWDKLKENAQHYLSIEGSKEAKIQAHVVNFPVDLIDRLVALKHPDLNGLFRSLLGDRLKLAIDKEPSPEGLAFKLTATAPLMQGDIKGQVSQGVFTLKEPSVFHFNLTPESINTFMGHHFDLLDSSRLEVIIQNLSFPLTFLDENTSTDPCQLGFQAQAKLSTARVDIQSIGTLDILNLQASIESPLCDPTIHMQMSGQAQQGKEEPFDIRFESTLNKPKKLSHLLEQVHRHTRSSLKISHFPLQLIPFSQKYSEFIDQIGPVADLQLLLDNKKEEGTLTLSLQTPHLIVKQAEFLLREKELILTSPVRIDWLTPSNCLQTLLHIEPLAFNQPCPLQITIKQLQIPLGHQGMPKFQVDSSISQLQLSQLLPWGILQIKDLNFKIEGQDWAQFSSQLHAELSLITPEGFYSPLLDHPIEFSQISTWKKNSTNKLDMLFGRFQLKNDVDNLEFEGQLANQRLTLTQPAKIQYALTPDALRVISHILKKEWPKLEQTAHLQLTIEPTSFDLTPSFLSFLRAQGVLEIDHLFLEETLGIHPILEELILPWNIDAPMNIFTVNLEGLASTKIDLNPSELSASVQVEQWLDQEHFDLTHAKAEIRLELTGMPTSTISLLLTKQDLSPLFGSVMDINLNSRLDRDHQTPGFWDMGIDSAEFHTRIRLIFDDVVTMFDPEKPVEIRWTITPEAYAFLKTLMATSNDWRLAAPTTLSGQLSIINFPLKNVSSESPLGQMEGNFKTTDIQWEHLPNRPIRIEGEVNSQNLREGFKFSSKALFSTSSPLTLEGKLFNLFDPQGRLNSWKKAGLQARLEAQHLTPDFLQALFFLGDESKQKIQALFGEALDAQANCQLQGLSGPIQAHVQGTQGSVQLDGKLNQGVLTLNAPLEGYVQVTPLLSETFLSQNMPLFGSAIAAERPIKLTIDPMHFSCPLIPFRLDQVTIGRGVLDLNKIHFRNEGELRSILTLIHPISDQRLMIWFTPVYFQLEHSKLTIKRFDMLVAHKYMLASWGSIHLDTHQADLILGLSPQSLQYAFGIHGLGDQYLLQIPLHTKRGKIEIDKQRAVGRISALMARMRGGTKGTVLGNLLDAAISGERDEVLPPSPTTNPFPWAGEFDTSVSSEHPSSDVVSEPQFSGQPQEDNREKAPKKRHKHPKDLSKEDVIQGIQQGASQVLDRLLGQ